MNGWLYDAIVSIGERGFLGAIRGELLSSISGEIVELGAGTGLTFAYYGSQAHVRAIEPDRSMLARAKGRASQSRARIDLIQGDDAILDTWPPESADYAVAALVLCSADDPLRTLRRLYRILKPKGRLITIEHVRAGDASARLQDWLTPFWRRIAANCHLNRVLEPQLHDAGFEDLQLKSRPVPPPLRRLVYGYAAKSTRERPAGECARVT
ncbi:MAG TPA: class I SAM-dependent methyltransferase [Candidatus Baltobacteraceae bacterium]|nr:class I SAM-dependent methyltransferase [Candidatus Baltobacteraceae bacterium]